MGLRKKERPVASREELDAYLDLGDGQVDARIVSEALVVEQVSDTVTIEDEVTSPRTGYFVRHKAEDGQDLTLFVPRGWQVGDPTPPEEPPYFLQPGDELPVGGLKVFVRSRHNIAE